MQRKTRAALLAGVMLLPVTAMGQQQIQWSQTLNLPKGLNLPKDAQADVLGIAPGDTFADTKAKLEAYVREANTRPQDKSVSESEFAFSLPLSGGQRLQASYVGRIEAKINRVYAPASPLGQDTSWVFFSSPASGYQVMGIQRVVIYNRQEDQPRISEVLNTLKAKLKASPQVFDGSSSVEYRFQFNDGRIYVPPGANINSCVPLFNSTNHNIQQNEVARINAKGDCDVVFSFRANYGVSKDHASAFWFHLSDHERAKQNTTADFAFFDAYVKNLQKQPGGAAPKL
jgi:hypothetical protein